MHQSESYLTAHHGEDLNRLAADELGRRSRTVAKPLVLGGTQAGAARVAEVRAALERRFGGRRDVLNVELASKNSLVAWLVRSAWRPTSVYGWPTVLPHWHSAHGLETTSCASPKPSYDRRHRPRRGCAPNRTGKVTVGRCGCAASRIHPGLFARSAYSRQPAARSHVTEAPRASAAAATASTVASRAGTREAAASGQRRTRGGRGLRRPPVPPGRPTSARSRSPSTTVAASCECQLAFGWTRGKAPARALRPRRARQRRLVVPEESDVIVASKAHGAQACSAPTMATLARRGCRWRSSCRAPS